MNSASSNLTNNATAASGAVSPTAGTPATPVAAAISTPVAVTASSNTTAPAAPAVTASPAFSPLYQQIKALITQSLQSGEW
ncbi:MAG: GntR family transcriptional regulator, partial [Janthinobacterium sp.]